MTQMNHRPKAKSSRRPKSQNDAHNEDARQSNEDDGVLSAALAKLNVAVDPAAIGPLFGRFQEAEEQNKDANEKKAAIFADAKAAGLDAGALRVAFRQRARELDKPEVGEKHDALNSRTRRYLEALRGDQALEGQGGCLATRCFLRGFPGLLRAPRALACA